MKKKITLFIGGVIALIFTTCSSEFDTCACYNNALKTDDTSILEEACQELIKDMDTEALKEASNDCFAEDVSDLVGGGVL